MAFVPSLLNPTDVRSLDSGAREIMSSLQLAHWQAGAAKLNHRVRFYSQSGRWWHVIEIEATAGTWAAKPGQPAHSISTKFALTMNLPANSAVVFTPTGFVSGYDSAHNQISLASAKLDGARPAEPSPDPDLRQRIASDDRGQRRRGVSRLPPSAFAAGRPRPPRLHPDRGPHRDRRHGHRHARPGPGFPGRRGQQPAGRRDRPRLPPGPAEDRLPAGPDGRGAGRLSRPRPAASRPTRCSTSTPTGRPISAA